jgi:hypothetical protein
MRNRVFAELLRFGLGAFFSYVVGMAVLYGFLAALLSAFDAVKGHEPLGDGLTLTFKMIWTVVVLLLAPGGAAAASLLLGGNRRAWVVVTAVGLYGLTVGLLLPFLGYLNDCAINVPFPPGAIDCD